MSDFSDEISEMIDSGPANEEPITEEIEEEAFDAAEEPKEPIIEDEELEVDEEPTEEIPDVEDEEEVYAPSTEGDEIEDEIEDREKLLVAEIERLNRIVAGLDQSPAPQETVEEPTEQQPEEPKQTEVRDAPQGTVDFFGDQDFDDVMDDRDAMNKVLNSAVQTSIAEASKRVMLSVPQLVLNYLTRYMDVKATTDNFYQTNDDLVDVKATVSAVATDIHNEHPDWDRDKVLVEAAKVTRRKLGLKQRITRQSKDRDPAFAKSGGSRTPPPKRSTGLEKEIADLMDDNLRI